MVYFNPVAPLTVNGASSGAFRRPQLAKFGNVGNDSAFGPGEVNVDLALNKLFTIRERYSLQLRAEAYNALNHPNYGNPNACVDCSLVRIPARSRMWLCRCGSCSSLPAFSFKHISLSGLLKCAVGDAFSRRISFFFFLIAMVTPVGQWRAFYGFGV